MSKAGNLAIVVLQSLELCIVDIKNFIIRQSILLKDKVNQIIINDSENIFVLVQERDLVQFNPNDINQKS